MPGQPFWTLGLMSGTSCDGVDAALVETDGETVSALGGGYYRAYSTAERSILLSALKAATEWEPKEPRPPEFAEAEAMLTATHAEVVEALLAQEGFDRSKLQVIGFHGQTVLHQPEKRVTVQLGDGAALANKTGVPVVFDFRTADVLSGGEGAPFASLYHAALVERLNRSEPVLVLNAGGVGNVTWIGPDGEVLAFDTGPANAPMDDWVFEHTGQARDEGGALASKGQVDEARIISALDHPYFGRCPPKSLDRLDFTKELARGLSLEDGAATLTAFSAAAVAAAGAHFPSPVASVVVCGGGRHNPALMAELTARLGTPVEPVESVGWRGDLIEAEAFGFLAARHLRGLPLSVPTTTGVAKPMPGGRLVRPSAV